MSNGGSCNHVFERAERSRPCSLLSAKVQEVYLTSKQMLEFILRGNLKKNKRFKKN